MGEILIDMADKGERAMHTGKSKVSYTMKLT